MPDDTTTAAAPTPVAAPAAPSLSTTPTALVTSDPAVLSRLTKIESDLWGIHSSPPTAAAVLDRIAGIEAAVASMTADYPKDHAGRIARLEQRLVAAGFFPADAS